MSKKKNAKSKKSNLPLRPPIRFTARKFKTRKGLISVVWADLAQRVKISRFSRREVVVGWEVLAPPNSEEATVFYEAVRITSSSPVAIEFRTTRRHSGRKTTRWQSDKGNA